ncbi:hypothetical protein SAMN04489841_1786 [Natrinema salaciae]|uniref:Uncharacterized protein n=1 Tax=Natrinema salaciae TaxID=1186196 RepID=A0A1H9G5M0_9EURY|nr:hypothetical protein SAMN04489841_1786 [Natrinema salaciae]
MELLPAWKTATAKTLPPVLSSIQIQRIGSARLEGDLLHLLCRRLILSSYPRTVSESVQFGYFLTHPTRTDNSS